MTMRISSNRKQRSCRAVNKTEGEAEGRRRCGGEADEEVVQSDYQPSETEGEIEEEETFLLVCLQAP
ncbi:unnamed protein product [Merluccius merluccius]